MKKLYLFIAVVLTSISAWGFVIPTCPGNEKNASDFYLYQHYYAYCADYSACKLSGDNDGTIDFNLGASIVFGNINLSSAQTCTLRLHFKCGQSNAQLTLTVNGSPRMVSIPYTDFAPSSTDISNVVLNAGANSISLTQLSEWPLIHSIELIAPVKTTVTLSKNDGTSTTQSVMAVRNAAMYSVVPPTRSGYYFVGYFDNAGMDEYNQLQYYSMDGTSYRNWDKSSSTATLYAHWTYTDEYFAKPYKARLANWKACKIATWDNTLIDFNEGSSLYFENIYISKAGTYRVWVERNSSSSNCVMEVFVNGTKKLDMALTDPSAWSSYIDLPLIAGRNTIQFKQKTEWPVIKSIKLVSYTVNVAQNDNSYGSVSTSSVANVPHGTVITTSTNKVTINGTIVTATPNTNTAQYTYTFNNWTNGTATVTSDMTVTANFTRTTNTYTVTINTNGAYGTVNKTTVSGVPYGTQITTSGNTINVNGTTVTATPATTTAQYSYSFTGWTNGTSIVTGNTTVTANFSRVTNNYTVTISASPSGYGSVDKATVANVPYGTVLSTSGNKVTINGTEVTATPTPATAQYTYAFSSWTNGTATVTGATTVMANFTRTTIQYTITFKNYDGTVLQSSKWDYGATPSYSGATPTKPATADYTYSHNGWTPAITLVTGAQIYTATFAQTVRPNVVIDQEATTASWTPGEERNVQLTRTLITTGYNTLCLPFDVASDELSTFGEGVQLYTLSSVEQTDGVTLNFTSASSIVAGTPYLVEVTSANANPTFTSRTLASTTPSSTTTTQGNATFYGAYVQTELQTSDYFLGANNLLYHPIPSDRTIKGLRGYFTINTPAGTPIRVAINQPTNIVSPSLSGEGRGEATKIIKDNKLLIIRDGKTYNAQGIRQ